ncbi:hypothetical protein OIT44_02910 [Weissella ceti]|uniref:Integral membrane protein n=1 Tax=Weissella ceti TaxID=759620 RepID=A0ABT3E3Q8_9LACO|nr:hypothetical protein [Weissella ceti]MCW0953022.1 hypothetical protein [Weissella ceti]QVK11568.1 hypothetical protein KHQ31_04920 [Weissella ceti]
MNLIKSFILVTVQFALVWFVLTGFVETASNIAIRVVEEGIPHGFVESVPVAFGLMNMIACVYLSYVVITLPSWLRKMWGK